MKILAFYLPQFHEIEDNNKWWGQGFTDWVNVKKAKPIFKGQTQPKIPLNNNYYDLSNPSTIKWQAKLAKEYGVNGWCIYHYWFNGKKLLEKPAEILLNHPEIEIEYCFSWANETWSRTWTGKEKEVLIEQSYGTESEWEDHFNYLLSFFKDKRYIKIDNKPMFVIYKSGSIPKCKEMMDLWNQLALNNGFEGVYFVETLNRGVKEKRNLEFSAKVEFEPAFIKRPIATNKVRIRRYIVRLINKLFKLRIPEVNKRHFAEEIKQIEKNLSVEGTFAGAFVGWDNTPRRDLAATYITSPTQREFKEYLKRKIQIGKNIYHTDFLFINAWNEWAEGTYLEPDIINKYKYLEVIKDIQKENYD